MGKAFRRRKMIKYPGFRRRLILNVFWLSDVDYQKKKWVDPLYVHSFWDYFNITIEIIFDEACLDENPEERIGSFLRNQAEVDALKPLVKALDIVLKQIGIEKPDEAYIDSPLWQDVVAAAKHAYEVMMENEDLDALLEAEKKRGGGTS